MYHCYEEGVLRCLCCLSMLWCLFVLHSPQGLLALATMPRPTCLCRYVAFSGSGNTLGGEASTSSSAPAAPAATGAAADCEWEGVDESKPTTSLQLRLVDGSRMVARFNTTHTVHDVRRFIHASRCVPAAASVTAASLFQDAG